MVEIMGVPILGYQLQWLQGQGITLSLQGRSDEAVAMLQRAVEADQEGGRLVGQEGAGGGRGGARMQGKTVGERESSERHGAGGGGG